MIDKDRQTDTCETRSQDVQKRLLGRKNSNETLNREQGLGVFRGDRVRPVCGTDHKSADVQPYAAVLPSVGVSLRSSGRNPGWLQSGMTKASILLGAGGVTLALLAVMTVLIADEFQPQDRVDLASFEINPKPDDIPILVDRNPPKLEKIEVPPPPPIVEITRTDQPAEPIIVPHQPKRVFDAKQYVIQTSVPIIPSDTDPQPLIRVPPIMPPRASRSGHCQMTFNIGPDGIPFTIAAASCSETLFQRAAIRAVGKWVYRPEIKDGLPVMQTGLTTTIRFRLMDERGEIIPE